MPGRVTDRKTVTVGEFSGGSPMKSKVTPNSIIARIDKSDVIAPQACRQCLTFPAFPDVMGGGRNSTYSSWEDVGVFLRLVALGCSSSHGSTRRVFVPCRRRSCIWFGVNSSAILRWSTVRGSGWLFC